MPDLTVYAGNQPINARRLLTSCGQFSKTAGTRLSATHSRSGVWTNPRDRATRLDAVRRIGELHALHAVLGLTELFAQTTEVVVHKYVQNRRIEH